MYKDTLTKTEESASGTCGDCNVTLSAPRNFTLDGLSIMMACHRNGTRFDGKYIPVCREVSEQPNCTGDLTK